jgi:hypothetical protein
MNKTCENCIWTTCSWLDKLFCKLKNRLDWQPKNPLPTGEFNPFSKTNANVPMPEVKPAKKDKIKIYVVYDPCRETLRSVHKTESGAISKCVEYDKEFDRSSKDYPHEYEEFELED